jgi:lipoprotein-anchoring transpeptidase ErfK/SrfK
VGDSQLRRISRVLANTGAALALAGALAGCAAEANPAPAAAAQALTPSTRAASPSPALVSAPPTSAAPATTKPAVTVPTTSTTKPPSTRAAVPKTSVAKAPGVPCSAAAVACVSLSRQLAWFVRDGKVVRGPVRVATGRAGYGTELGTFQVYRKNRMWYSTIYNNAPMPYSVFFDGGEAFHEGSTAIRSHGCVHLSATNAAWVFNFLHIGDTVQVVR